MMNWTYMARCWVYSTTLYMFCHSFLVLLPAWDIGLADPAPITLVAVVRHCLLFVQSISSIFWRIESFSWNVRASFWHPLGRMVQILRLPHAPVDTSGSFVLFWLVRAMWWWLQCSLPLFSPLCIDAYFCIYIYTDYVFILYVPTPFPPKSHAFRQLCI